MPQGRTWLRKVWRAVVALGIALALVAIYYVFGGVMLSGYETRVHDAIKKAIDSGQSKIVVSGMVDLNWKTVCMVAPYTSEVNFQRTLEYDIMNYEAMRWWIDDENYWSLVFITDSREIIPIRIRRWEFGDYSLPQGKMMQCFPRDNAILEYENKDSTNGPPRYFRLIGERRL